MIDNTSHVYYETSTDNGNSWQIRNSGRPLDNGSGRAPSISAYQNKVVIVFQQRGQYNHYNIPCLVFTNKMMNINVI